ncbi:MAG: sugar phosphate isomerase/epimerase [Ignavibacterium sp.]|jgi:sugar phosphate isomerase/epimerase
MKRIGFLTSCLPEASLETLIRWTRGTRFDALEVAAWPSGSERKYKGRHIDVDSFNATADHIKDLLAETGTSISALAYYDNIIDPNPAAREQVQAHLRRVIEAAAALNVNLVGTFVGAHPNLTPQESFREIVKELRKILSFAKENGVRVMIENCPMTGWQRFNAPGNLAYSPELWDALFHELPYENLGLNFDPSHLYWLGVDYEKAVRDFREKIFHVHAKDCELLPDGLYRYGIYGPQLTSQPRDPGWWRYRLPGNGSIDWARFIGALDDTGFDGTLSIELEDPEWEDSEDQIRAALLKGADFLSGFWPPKDRISTKEKT